MGTVYIVQDDGRKNLAPAMEHGKNVVALATRDMPLFGNTEMRVAAVRAKLKKFNPDEDHLILAGDPLLIGIAFSVLAANHGVVPCLKWDRQSMSYYPIRIKL